LAELGVAYDCVDVDQLDDKEGDRVESEEVKKWNKAGTYPTLVINDQKAIINFKEDEIRAALS
jgi:glutaredoxin